ncbi:MAG: helix-turn-helix transcriptional regulator [Patulibacter sp.]
MKYKTADEIRAARGITAERRAAIEEQKELLRAEIQLHALREARGVTQADLAERMAIARPRVSKIESATEDMRISTIDRYVTALGGHLKITAVFEDGNELSIRDAEAA